MKRKFEMGRQPANTKIGDKKVTRIRVRGGNYKFRALRLDHGNYSWAGESVTRKTRILKVVYNSTNNELVRTNTLVKGSIIQIDSTPYKAWYLQHYNVDLSNKKSIETKRKGAAEKKEAAAKKEAAKKDTTKKDTTKKETTKKDTTKKDTTKKDETTKKDTTKKAEKTKTEVKSSQKDLAKPKTAEKAKGSKAKEVAKKAEEGERKDLTKKAKAKFAKRNSTRVLDAALGDQFKTGRVYAKITSRPGQSGRCDGYILEGDELAFYLKKINLKKKK
jgi:ribosomal protein eS8